jgi:hypothetical protein
VGVFYADSTTPNAFGESKADRDALIARVEEGARKVGLTEALSAMVAMLPDKPLIPMLGKPKA